jgi:AraC-like DNA-binding protein
MTIQQFIIINKIERIKELLLYGEMNLSEISYKLNYSSIAHLSNQFKKITGITPSSYKNTELSLRIPLEEIGLAKL